LTVEVLNVNCYVVKRDEQSSNSTVTRVYVCCINSANRQYVWRLGRTWSNAYSRMATGNDSFFVVFVL